MKILNASAFLLMALLSFGLGACDSGSEKQQKQADIAADSGQELGEGAESSAEQFPKVGQKVSMHYWSDSTPQMEKARGWGVGHDMGGYWVENRKGLWGYMDEDSVLRIPPRYQEMNNTARKPFVDSIALRQLPDGRWHYLRPSGEIVHETAPDAEAFPFREARALAMKELGKGYAKKFLMAHLHYTKPDRRGKGQRIKSFRNGVAPMRFGNNWRYVDWHFEQEPLCDLKLDYASELMRLGTGSSQAVGHIRQRKGDKGQAYWNRTDSLYWFWRSGSEQFLQGMVEKNTHFDGVEYAGRGRLLILESHRENGSSRKALARVGSPTPPPKNEPLPPGPPKLELITGFKFTELEPFSEGKAVAALGGPFPAFYLERQVPLPERANARADTLVLQQERDPFEKGQKVLIVHGFMLPFESLPKVGYIGPKGSWKLPPKPCLAASSFSQGKAARYTPQGWHFIDSSGNPLFNGRSFQNPGFYEGHYGASNPPHLIELEPPQFRNGRAVVVQDSAYAIIDERGQWVLEPDPQQKMGGKHFRQISPLAEGRAKVAERYIAGDNGPLRWAEKRVGFLDSSGQVAIERRYDKAHDFQEGRAAVFQEGKGWGFIDKQGQVVVPLKEEKVRDFRAGRAAFFLKEEGWGFLDRQGQVALPPIHDKVLDYTGGRATVRTPEGAYQITRWGQKISN